MLPLLATAAVLLASVVAPRPQAPQQLHCRMEIPAGGKSQRCHVTLAEGRQVRACTEADRQAGQCDTLVGQGRYVAWVVGTGPGRCRITQKKTKWDRAVHAKLSKGEGGPSTCDLYVEVR